LTVVLHTLDVADETESFDSLDPDSVVTIAGRYSLEICLGRGAAGSVYRAYDHKLDRRVALKLLRPGEMAVGEREAHVLAKVAHRNIVTIHDFGHDHTSAHGHRYLVLELLEGRNFQEWLRERPVPEDVIASFIEAGQGLAAAHLAGLVHRDVKPSNMILTDDGRVVVIDFGLAQSIHSTMGSTLGPLLGGSGISNTSGLSLNQFTEGTLAYMAPERLAGHDSDARSDQFSFCVALWEGLTGANPFSGADPLARYRSIHNGPGGRNGSGGRMPAAVPRHIVAALERGLSFDREQRFSTMLELLRELERPAPVRQRKGVRPVLSAVALTATFLIGWGFMPEAATIEEAHSSLDPRMDAAMTMVESSRMRAAAGDGRAALNDLLAAAEVVDSLADAEADCSFGAAVPRVADAMVSGGSLSEAQMAYGIALRFARDCPELSKEDLKARREAARAQAMLSEP
jgi:predicted Ser/Thr protein kinase